MSTGRASPWQGWTYEQVDLLRYAIVDVTRSLARQLPAPRGMPFFGLDHPAGEFAPFERLAAHGIFRKYESVLMIGAGLGGAARWCHVHFGCDVTGIDSVAWAAALAQALSQRSGLARSARFLAASPADLPLRSRAFTHAWVIEGLDDVEPVDARVDAIFHAVRLGGIAALQRSEAPSAWAATAGAALTAAGFVEVAVATVERPPLRESARRARERLLQALREARADRGPATAEALAREYDAWPAGGGSVTQVFGRRPS